VDHLNHAHPDEQHDSRGRDDHNLDNSAGCHHHHADDYNLEHVNAADHIQRRRGAHRRHHHDHHGRFTIGPGLHQWADPVGGWN
ncbi:MAG TPA: hypothetical protein VFV02_05655, partial [Acidimicrobiales bacterium]|nr:hypothetical protein [Acidimicrobiales bacterium]